MKITKVQIPNFIKNAALTVPLLLAASTITAKDTNLNNDVFVKTEQIDSPKDTRESVFMAPAVKLAGTTVYPAIVIDLSDKQVYHYDTSTFLIDSYPIRFCEDQINTGLNLIDIKKHYYNDNNVAEKIVLTEVNRTNGRVKDTHQQVLVGAENANIYDDTHIFTNVILINNDSAKKITDLLTDEQYVLIRK